MEPTLHCAKPAIGCLGTADDRVVVRVGGSVKQGDIVVFKTPGDAAIKCGEGGIFVKRVIGVSGETLREDDRGFVWVRGPNDNTFVKLKEPYLATEARLADSAHFGQTWHVPKGDYFMMGDNRSESCDSRSWGSVPPRDILGPVTQIIRQG